MVLTGDLAGAGFTLRSSSASEMRSSSHQGDAAPHSDAVWNDEERDGGVHVHSEAVTNSSSDLLSSAEDLDDDLMLEYHSWNANRLSLHVVYLQFAFYLLW